jgi:Tfp pilus assembly protein PilF
LVLSAVSCWLTYLVQQGSGAVRSMEAIPLASRVANALVSYVAYIGKMIFPLRLAVFYPYPAVISMWKIAGACCILVFIFCLAWKLRTRHPYILIGWLWYIGTLFPVIGLVQIGAQAMADRYSYVPLIGLFIAIVWSVAGFTKIRPLGTKLIPLAAALIVGFLGMLTWVQVGYWRNSIELYQHAIKVTRDNYLAHNNLGNALLIQGKNDEAYRSYAEALRIYPDYADAHYNIGRLLDARGKQDAAIIHYGAAIKVNPRFKKAYYNLGNVLARKGSYAEAFGNYDQALQIDPDYAEAHNNLGVVLVRQGKINEALSHFLKAVQLKDGYVEARDNLLKALSDMQRSE